MTETHETIAASALAATRELHDMLRCVSKRTFSAEEMSKMKMLTKASNNAVAAMRRHHSFATQQASVRESLLREALHGELLDRQARGARIEERYRALSESRTSDSAIDAARRSTLTLDQSIAALCSHHSAATSGTHQTQQMAVAAAVAAER